MNKTNSIENNNSIAPKTVEAELAAPVVGKTPKGRLIEPFNLGYAKTKEFYGKVVAKSERNAVVAGLQKVAYAVATIFAAIVETLKNVGAFVLNRAIAPINFVYGLVAKPKKETEPTTKPLTPTVVVEEEKPVVQAKVEEPVVQAKVEEPVVSEKVTAIRQLEQKAKEEVENRRNPVNPEILESLNSIKNEISGLTRAIREENDRIRNTVAPEILASTQAAQGKSGEGKDQVIEVYVDGKRVAYEDMEIFSNSDWEEEVASNKKAEGRFQWFPVLATIAIHVAAIGGAILYEWATQATNTGLAAPLVKLAKHVRTGTNPDTDPCAAMRRPGYIGPEYLLYFPGIEKLFAQAAECAKKAVALVPYYPLKI